jgi:hypothetical protein
MVHSRDSVPLQIGSSSTVEASHSLTGFAANKRRMLVLRPVISHKVLLVAAQSAKLTGVKNRLKMRPFLRAVAVIVALCVFLALLQTIDILLRGGMSSLVRSGVLGAATILGWLLILRSGSIDPSSSRVTVRANMATSLRLGRLRRKTSDGLT